MFSGDLEEDFKCAMKGRAAVLGLPVDNELLDAELGPEEVFVEAGHRIHGRINRGDGAHVLSLGQISSGDHTPRCDGIGRMRTCCWWCMVSIWACLFRLEPR